MPASCSAYGCTNRHHPGTSVKFYMFPFSRKTVLKAWIHAVRRKNFRPTKSSVICSVHFRDTDYVQSNNGILKKLKLDAVPSIFENFPEHLKPKSAKKRRTREKNVDIQGDDSIDVACEKDRVHCLTDEVNCTENTLSTCRKCVDVSTGTDSKEFATRATQTAEKAIPHTVNQLKEENRILKQRVKRQSISINSLKDLLKALRTKNMVGENYEEFLSAHFKDVCATIFVNELKNGNNKASKHGKRYSEAMKRFALTLHYNSPHAYKFCRRHLTLPHPTTISSWISSVEANPGFMEEILQGISGFPDEKRDVVLIADAMCIKSFVQWDKKREKMWGYCDFGQIEVETGEQEATEVLVFMCACLNGSWRLPIAYFFQNKCDAPLLGELIKTAFHLCDRANLRIHAFTCDGTNTNWASLKTFGFLNKFDSQNIQFELKYTYNNVEKTVYFTPDACHAVKLARNALAAYKKFKYENEIISWVFVERLHDLQKILHFKFGNKLTPTHIKFKNSIMKVKYATQVLSSSVADSIDFLCDLGLPDFRGAKAAATFLRTIDRIFDFLNSRHPFAKGYKVPVRLENFEFLTNESLKWINYLLKLRTIHDEPLYETPRRTFIISLITCIKSVLAVSKNLFCTRYYNYVLTYKFSQDIIELFFGIIRLRFGCNNNPTPFQFFSAMKTLLLKNDITPSALGNSLLLAAREENSYNYDNFITARTQKKRIENTVEDFDEKEEDLLNSLLEIEEVDPKGVLRDYIIYHISGFIVRKLTTKVLDCFTCKRILLKPTNEHNYCLSSLYDRFVQYRNRGGLVNASRDVFLVVKECESYVILYINDLHSLKYSKIILAVQQKMLDCELAFKSLNCNSEVFQNHRLLLIQKICALYLKIRIHSLVQWHNSRKISTRKALSKTILFNND